MDGGDGSTTDGDGIPARDASAMDGGDAASDGSSDAGPDAPDCACGSAADVCSVVRPYWCCLSVAAVQAGRGCGCALTPEGTGC